MHNGCGLDALAGRIREEYRKKYRKKYRKRYANILDPAIAYIQAARLDAARRVRDWLVQATMPDPPMVLAEISDDAALARIIGDAQGEK